LLYPLFEYLNDEISLFRERQALMYMTVRHLPNGAEFTWLATQQTLRVTLKEPGDGKSGFSYSLNPLPDFPRTEEREFLAFDDLLHIRFCGDVDFVLLPMPEAQFNDSRGGVAEIAGEVFPDPIEWAKRNNPPYRGSADPALYRPIVESLFFRLERVDRLDELPAAGAVFKVHPDYNIAVNEYGRFLRTTNFTPWAQLVADLVVGSIPLLGDIADFADFNLALRTGKDKWGNEVGNFDLVLMGLAIIPLLGSLFQVFRRGARTAEAVADVARAVPP
jgi:hypothetical protein